MKQRARGLRDWSKPTYQEYDRAGNVIYDHEHDYHSGKPIKGNFYPQECDLMECDKQRTKLPISGGPEFFVTQLNRGTDHEKENEDAQFERSSKVIGK